MRRLALVALLALAGCGKEGLLAPAAGQAPPPKPQQAATAPTPEEMLKLPPQSQPKRVDDPATKSEERPADRFNLPPPG
jgi:hypothetical protein